MKSFFTRSTGWLLLASSIGLFLFTVFAYHQQPDALAAFTVIPPWIWSGVGIAAAVLGFVFLRYRSVLILVGIWFIVSLISADETSVITNLSNPKPKPGKPEPVLEKTPIRIITLNASFFRSGNPTSDIARWKPDIVLLQELSSAQVRHVAASLYQTDGDYRAFAHNGIATRWDITKEYRHPNPRFKPINFHVTIEHPDHGPIEIANLHYSSAATNLELWKRDTWKTHRDQRRQRREEVEETLRIFKRTNTSPASHPIILGGDFNTPPNDASLDPLKTDFTDVFASVGRGWGNTYHRRLPLFRIDQLHVTKHFTPIRCRAVTTRHSDHRFVVADVLLD